MKGSKAKCLENTRICKTYITIYVNLKNTWLLNTDFTKITGEIVDTSDLMAGSMWDYPTRRRLNDCDTGPSINQHCVTPSPSLGHQRFLSHEWALQDKGRRRVAPKGWLPANSFVMSLSRHLDVTPEDNRAVLPPYDVTYSSDASVINFSAGRVKERGGGSLTITDHSPPPPARTVPQGNWPVTIVGKTIIQWAERVNLIMPAKDSNWEIACPFFKISRGPALFALLIKSFPANTKHWYNIFTMLDQRLRRWADVV